MLGFDFPVSRVPKIGPRNKLLLERLEIFTVRDLLYHIPFRYDDFSQTKRIADVSEGDAVTLRVVMGPVENIFTKYGKKITKATVADHSGRLDLIWFNQHFIKKTLTTGETYTLSGKVGLFNSKLCIVSPEVEQGGDKSLEKTLNTGRLVPIYPETQGISSKWLRSRINDVFDAIGEIKESLPNKLIEKNKLKNLAWSLKHIHFPQMLEQAQEAKTRLAFDELFFDFYKMEQRKHEWNQDKQGFEMKNFYAETENFIRSLPFELTDSQAQSITEITTDLTGNHPMNRMLEGDVGTGKTVVTVVAAYLTYLNEYKTIYLAPTEILAQQHFDTFSKFLKQQGITIGLVTGSKKIKNTDADIFIGTHALLYNDEIFKNAALVIIDEQHRFGVEQRGKAVQFVELKNKKGNKPLTPNLLTMTATPIPRTLALTVFGDLELSVLKTHPKSKRDITTKIIPENKREDVYKWIINHDKPTFIVCPFIEQSYAESLQSVKSAEEEFKRLSKGPLAGQKLGLIHGRMSSKEKEDIISDFRNGKIKILVATPVIEVGIDVPDAAVIVIEGGERYGLASLHQLRGRVGRNDDKGYCFVFMSGYSNKAYARLKNLEEIEDGLKLAEIDLRMRGQGDLFSTMQHGFKRYKIADLDNFPLLEKAKLAAEDAFFNKDEYEGFFEDFEAEIARIRNN